MAIIGLTSLFSFVIAVFAFPDNALFVRIGNIFSGQDVSGKGRTFDAFYLASKILEKKSHVWGIGLGQLKVAGANIIRSFYSYDYNFNIITIPNAVAETWVIFGWAGLFIRIGMEIFLFIRTKVWTNYYRLLLFLFIFIYQFTGSYITNLAEYTIWVFAFTNVFPEFDVKRSVKRNS